MMAQRGRERQCDSIRAPFWRLCLAHSIRVFSGKPLPPPFENGKSWSKCSWSVDPCRTHLSWSHL
jgi:hypothetical protein